MDLNTHLSTNKIAYSLGENNTLIIGGKTFEVMYPIDGVLFDENFKFTSKPELNTDFLIFQFGGVWYCTSSNDKGVKLTKLKYLGDYTGTFANNSFLGMHAGFEILNGSGQYKDWCSKAKFLGIKNLGICEKNTLAGVMKFQEAGKKVGIGTIIGATYTVVERTTNYRYDLKFYVKDEIGWNNLLMINREVNVVNQRFIYQDTLFSLLEGLVLVFDPKSVEYDYVVKSWKGIGDLYYQLDTAAFEDEEYDTWYLKNLKKFTESRFIPTNIIDAYYLDKEDSHIKFDLNKISGLFEYKSNNQYFKDTDDYLDELSLLVKDDIKFTTLLARMMNSEQYIVDSCKDFSIKTGERHLPKYVMTKEEYMRYEDNEDLFWGLIGEGLSKLAKEVQPEYLARVEKEVKVIELGNVMDYFLMLHDIIGWCNRVGILVGIGRGSAGGSVVSMLMGLIHLDPIEFGLLFERFLNEGRMQKLSPFNKIIFETDEGIREYWEDEVVTVERNGVQEKTNVRNINIKDIILDID